MSKNNQKILLYLLISFSLYCAIIIGKSWDEGAELIKGKVVLDYLFSLGEIDNKNFYREYYSPIYLSLLYLLTKVFPLNYQIEASHIINLVFSLSVIFGIGKLCKELFNEKVGKIAFLILFFYPIFFGHMAMNNKDLILALSHVWITYLLFRYLKVQINKSKTNKYVIYIGLLAAIGTGIQLVFLGSLIPVILFILFEILVFKKITISNFSKRKFFLDVIKSFVVFYILLVIFWIDTYPNVFVLPFTFFLETLSENFITGWPFNLIDGNYYLSNEIPKSYFFINLLFKSPEYFLFSYLIFILLQIKTRIFFIENFNFFYYKLSLIIIILIFPSLVLLVVPYPIYDGMRLFLWSLPYFCIVPAITVYYLIENFNYLSSKILSTLILFFAVLFLYKFFIITPYQYTYLNIFNGQNENRYKKFENDYWATSIKELINSSKLSKNDNLLISTCGVNDNIVKYYFDKYGYSNVNFVKHAQSNFVIMTNRTVFDETTEQITNCFDKFGGYDHHQIKKDGLLLSVIRRKN